MVTDLRVPDAGVAPPVPSSWLAQSGPAQSGPAQSGLAGLAPDRRVPVAVLPSWPRGRATSGEPTVTSNFGITDDARSARIWGPGSKVTYAPFVLVC